jgi:hypothetical protein
VLVIMNSFQDVFATGSIADIDHVILFMQGN